MKSKQLVIGSRGSELALWQANHVKSQLESKGYEVTIEVIKTRGDQIQNLSFDKIEGKGFFTKEIENALLENKVDLAVHSLKDLETTQPEGLCLAGVSERENPFDILLIKPDSLDQDSVWKLKNGAKVGTSSARRKAWIKHTRPDVQLVDLRGNVPTRIQKLRDGDLDAIVLANAGVRRIEADTSGLHIELMSETDFVPAPAQGVLGFQTRDGDDFAIGAVSEIACPDTKVIASRERDLLARVGGGCHVPFGAYCVQKQDSLSMAVAYAPDGDYFHFTIEGSSDSIVDKAKSKLDEHFSSHAS